MDNGETKITRTATSNSSAGRPTALVWTGRVLSALVVVLLLFSGGMKLTRHPDVTEGFVQLGYPENLAVPIGLVEVACAVLYAIPQTAVLGAILLTGYLGGATATHVRMGEPFYGPIVLGVVIWIALCLRSPQVRAAIFGRLGTR
jgi:hypothetical protein